MSLVDTPPSGVSPVQGQFSLSKFQQLASELNPDIQQNINYLEGTGDFSGIEPDEYNVPKTLLENYQFGQPGASTMSTVGESRVEV